MSEQHVPQREPDLSAAERTGDAAVDAAVADLRAVDPDLPPAGQLPVLVAVHEALQQRLSSTEG